MGVLFGSDFEDESIKEYVLEDADYWQNVEEITKRANQISPGETLRVVVYDKEVETIEDCNFAPFIKLANKLREGLVGRIALSWTPSVWVKKKLPNNHQVYLDI